MKIKFNSDDNVLFKKELEIHDVMIIIMPVIPDNEYDLTAAFKWMFIQIRWIDVINSLS